MKRIACFFLAVIALSCTGCATAYMEREMRSEMIRGGMEPIAGEPQWVKDANGGAHNVKALTKAESPWLYRAAQVLDYVVLPLGATWGIYEGIDYLKGDSHVNNSKSYIFQNDGDAAVQDGSPGAGQNQSESTTTSTSTSTQVGE